jgi:hypothetical protein
MSAQAAQAAQAYAYFPLSIIALISCSQFWRLLTEQKVLAFYMQLLWTDADNYTGEYFYLFETRMLIFDYSF